MRRTWQYLLFEPFTWLFCCIFQPARFRREVEIRDLSKRIVPMFRLALPLFLISYPFALLMRMGLCQVFPGLDPGCFSDKGAFPLDPSLLSFLLSTARATTAGVVFGIAWGIAGGIAWGIGFGLMLTTFVGSVWVIAGNILWRCMGIVAGVTAGNITAGIAVRTMPSMVKHLRIRIVVGVAGGIAGAILVGIAWGIVGAIVGGIALSIAVVITMDTTQNIEENMGINTAARIAIGIGGGIIGGFIGGLLVAIVLIVGLGIKAGLTGGLLGGTAGDIAMGSAGGISGGLVIGLTWGLIMDRVRGIGLGLAVATAIGIGFTTTFGITDGIAAGTPIALTFTISYLLGYYRLPLYPVSGLSAFKAYLASRKNPLQVFRYLHRSSLYWDERVFLPLPGLKRMLLIAAEQNEEQALEEIAFIVAERPQQLAAARSASLEIAIHDLEMRDSLHEIARASQRLAEILPQDAGLIDPRWVQPFVRLNDASRDAARYCSPLGWQARRDALEDMLTNLKRVYPNVAFHDVILNKRLSVVVNSWQMAARHEQAVLERTPDKIGQIDNPYNPGQALKLRDSLFVGRHDLVQQLEEALNRGSRRPTFLLNGERRMGKSSTLKQLPNLLGARYLPIVYDLQNRGISSSTAAFLGTIAEEIYKVMSARGMKVKKLEYARLREASRENEAAVYHLFEQWFRDMEHTLEQEDRTLLLLFDEFEKLEEAEQDGYLNLRLLLDWFRSVIQNHPRLALLFSGVRSFGEMGMNWAGYFVNVQTLRVSFLRPAEARQLITRPIPHFPSEQIYGEGLVEEIMRVTGCHPFLVQAVCSALIEHLNAGGRGRAEVQDVGHAVNQVLENWWDTYFRDLWNRTTHVQQTCLIALRAVDQGDQKAIVHRSGLDERTVSHALQSLLKRDLVLLENGNYHIATPIFSEWIKRIC